MTLKTGFLLVFFPQQSLTGRTMRIMTRETLALANRFMNGCTVQPGLPHIGMTTKTKPRHLLLNKPFIFGHMRIMATLALTFGNGLMHHRLCVVLTVMTAEAEFVLSGESESRRTGQHT